MDKLVEDFIHMIGAVSYYNAGEGNNWAEERDEAYKASIELRKLKAEMVRTYGKEFTAKIIRETPNLCSMELSLEGV